MDQGKIENEKNCLNGSCTGHTEKSNFLVEIICLDSRLELK